MTATAATPVELCLLGPIELRVGGQVAPLPRSKKTRALLAYLAVSGKSHRRDRLFALLWEMTDDPRGALRWSLSRLRGAFGSAAGQIASDNAEVSLAIAGVTVDVHTLAQLHEQGHAAASLEALERATELVRGEFLEGLELPDFLDFSAWCT